MKALFCVLMFATFTPIQMAFATSDAVASATTDPASTEASLALSAARSLCPEYFERNYQGTGEELKCSLKLETPSPIDGWPGRWRMHGLATLRHYRTAAADGSLAAREQDIRKNKRLTAKQIRNQVENLYFIRSEVVEFDVEVSKIDSTPDISVTIR